MAGGLTWVLIRGLGPLGLYGGDSRGSGSPTKIQKQKFETGTGPTKIQEHEVRLRKTKIWTLLYTNWRKILNVVGAKQGFKPDVL